METVVVIGCPACGRRYRFDTRRFGMSGVRVRCRSCEMIMQVRVKPEMMQPEAGNPGPIRRAGSETSVPDSMPSTARPAATPAEAVESSPRGKSEGLDSAPETVGRGALVADRDVDRRRLLVEVLKKHGFTVSAAEDGIEARRIVAADRPAVVFLNAFLRGVLGVTLCAEIKRHPELASTEVVLVGSQYRRGRFVRDAGSLYGANAFLDGSGTEEEILRQAGEILRELQGAPGRVRDAPDDGLTELKRLARIIAGDIILYNPATAAAEIAAGRFFETFAEEIREGESLVNRRFPSLGNRRGVFHDTLKETIAQYGRAAGIPAPVDSGAGGC